MNQKLFLIIFAVILAVSFSPAYAQHHSGSLAPPVDFDGLKLALITLLTPEDFTSTDSENANLSIRLFDSDTNTNVKSVTYRIQIFHEDNLVANEYFFDEDGKLNVEIKPKTECLEQELWKCTKYFGEKHPIAGAYFARGDSIPVIQGPVFDKSGQYQLKLILTGQNSQNFEEFFVSQVDFDISGMEKKEKKTVIIPDWVKQNAGWWSKGLVGDSDFVTGIQYLISSGVLVI